MKNEITEEKACENCMFYLQHYIKDVDRFRRIWQGHCINKKQSGRFRKTDKVCECWQPIAENNDESKNSIKATLEKMAERINQIAAILEDSF